MNNLQATRPRIQSIDLLRGIVMVIMALDHTRDFFFRAVIDQAANAAMDPTNMQTTFPALFFTRWITHYCAPVFLLLAGTSIYLMTRKKSRADLSLFLLKRGIWLIIVEAVIITFAWTFNPSFEFIILQVIWAIGISMIIMALLVQFSFRTILVFGLVVCFGHNLLMMPGVADSLRSNTIMDVAYYANFAVYPVGSNHYILVVYSFLAWTGVMAMGYCLGKWFEKGADPAVRRKRLFITGAALTVLFVVLRLINGYGDPTPWSTQKNATFTFLSFLNVNKYPPSLMFLCMTIGPALILLGVLENVRNRLTDFFNVYGRVPLFYYILHFYLLHLLVVIVFYLSGFGAADINTPGNPFLFRPNTFGFNLWGVYGIWLLVVFLLYPLCKRYDRYKSTTRTWWTSYL